MAALRTSTGQPESRSSCVAGTIFCCVERGRLEAQTLLMLEILRRWGGPLGQSRILAMFPRQGAPLTKATWDGLDAMGAEVHDASRFNRMSWFNLYGKIAAALMAEEIATTPVMIWLDSDILVLKPIVELLLDEDVDFTARREWLPPAVFSDGDVHVGY